MTLLLGVLGAIDMGHVLLLGAAGIATLALPWLVWIGLGMRFIPNDRIGVVEKLWSRSGSIAGDRIIALNGEAGLQADVLRGGLHFALWPWQYRIHKLPLTVVPQGKIGYVFARDGQPLRPEQTLGFTVACHDFQNAREFLEGAADGKTPPGQRGRQRAILREGVYAVNLALFSVITQEQLYALNTNGMRDGRFCDDWRKQLLECGGFDPVVIGQANGHPAGGKPPVTEQEDPSMPQSASDLIGVVTVHDGPALEPGQLIAPPVDTELGAPNYHSNFQNIEAFLRAGGRRGRQMVTLTDGTYFINRWFATVELMPKMIVPIGYVGVVVSYFGKVGDDVSGISFRHGERVDEGSRGVQAKTLSPGKYAFNTYAGRAHLVPTTNFVLHWITGRTESHRYDESLKSIDLVTADAYEPRLPLSVVVHIDYQKAASVVQRFGDVKKLITQTLDPMLSAYFRDIAHKKTMLQLLQQRDLIQAEARNELRSRFVEFDIELVDVLIGKPDTEEATGEIETLLEQLRLRQLSREQIETYQQQSAAAAKLKELRMAQALAEKQTELTNSRVEVDIAENRGEAELVHGRKRAAQVVVDAEADQRRRLLLAEADAKAVLMQAESESRRVALEGEAQARVLQQKISSYGDPRLYALSLVAQHFSQSKQPLVPSHLFMTGGSHDNGQTAGNGLLNVLMDMLIADRAGFPNAPPSVAATSVTSDRCPTCV